MKEAAKYFNGDPDAVYTACLTVCAILLLARSVENEDDQKRRERRGGWRGCGHVCVVVCCVWLMIRSMFTNMAFCCSPSVSLFCLYLAVALSRTAACSACAAEAHTGDREEDRVEDRSPALYPPAHSITEKAVEVARYLAVPAVVAINILMLLGTPKTGDLGDTADPKRGMSVQVRARLDDSYLDANKFRWRGKRGSVQVEREERA